MVPGATTRFHGKSSTEGFNVSEGWLQCKLGDDEQQRVGVQPSPSVEPDILAGLPSEVTSSEFRVS